jgi:hypothetical protein
LLRLGRTMLESRSSGLPDSVSFGDDFELDVRAYELRSGGVPLKLKPIPMELLLFLIHSAGFALVATPMIPHGRPQLRTQHDHEL